MKYQVLFRPKNNEKILKTVVCCSRNLRLRVMLYHKHITHRMLHMRSHVTHTLRKLLDMIHVKYSFGKLGGFECKGVAGTGSKIAQARGL